MRFTEPQKVEIKRHISQFEKYVSDTKSDIQPQEVAPDVWEYSPSIVTEALLKKVPFFSLTLQVTLLDNKLIYTRKCNK